MRKRLSIHNGFTIETKTLLSVGYSTGKLAVYVTSGYEKPYLNHLKHQRLFNTIKNKIKQGLPVTSHGVHITMPPIEKN